MSGRTCSRAWRSACLRAGQTRRCHGGPSSWPQRMFQVTTRIAIGFAFAVVVLRRAKQGSMAFPKTRNRTIGPLLGKALLLARRHGPDAEIPSLLAR